VCDEALVSLPEITTNLRRPRRFRRCVSVRLARLFAAHAAAPCADSFLASRQFSGL